VVVPCGAEAAQDGDKPSKGSLGRSSDGLRQPGAAPVAHRGGWTTDGPGGGGRHQAAQ
jgi:hypothetical protein